MSPKATYNLAIVGGGQKGMSILEALVPPRRGAAPLCVAGVADLNPQAPGILYARRHNLVATVDFTELLQLPDLDIIIDATGRPEVSRRLNELRGETLLVLSVDRPCSPENFWDLTFRDLLHSEENCLRSKVESEIKLACQRSHFQMIFDHLPDAVMVIDLDHRIVEANRAMLDMVGLRRDKVVGKHCYEVSHHLRKPCAIPDHPCPWQETLATGEAASATHVHFDKDGREHYVHVVCHPLFDEQGKIRQVIDVSRDITQEITRRDQLLHDDKMASLGKLAASIVHEINNPLTGILNFIKLIQRLLGKGPLGGEDLGQLSTYLDLMYNETSRVSQTASSLLAFSRKSEPELQPVNLNALLTATLSLAEYQLGIQHIKVERGLAESLLPVMADQGQMQQAFLNLLLNAMEAMPGGGTLTVSTRNARHHNVVIQFADTGVGISKESFSKIFEPFYTTKTTGSSVGLGLSVVYGIIRDHQGSIKVDSTMGKGTVFTVRLPAVKPEE